MKDFDNWNNKKKKLDFSKRFLNFHEREIWWCSIGLNVGREQDGHGVNFERPVIVIKILSSDTFIGAPLSTKKRLEKFQSPANRKNVRGFVLLDQVRVFDCRRLHRKIDMLNQDEFNILKEKLKNFF